MSPLSWAARDDGRGRARPVYPASYEFDNVVSVAASDNKDQLTWFSNFGLKSVDLMAPGWSILSTLPWGRYAEDSGTSMAAPHVAGAAALLWSMHPTWNYSDIKKSLLESVDVLPTSQGKMVSGGRLNLEKLLRSGSGV